MREISCETITASIERLCIKAATVLPPSLAILLECAFESEESSDGVTALEFIIENFKNAALNKQPICRDTDMVVIFADIGQDIHITGGSFEDAVNNGARRGMASLYSNTNISSVVHTRLITGDKIEIHVVPRCFRSETMSTMQVFMPDDSAGMIEEFIVDTVSKAGLNACPPIVVGVGLGGTVEQCALIAKRALFRSPDTRNGDEYYAKMEKRVLERINRLGIGPRGAGGRYTAVAVNIETFPLRTAGIHCVVNLGCHATQHAQAIL